MTITASNNDWVSAPPAIAQQANLQFTDITVSDGVTWTVPSGLTIKATGTLSLGANAHLIVRGVKGNGDGISAVPAFFFNGGVGTDGIGAAQILTPLFGGGAGGASSPSNAARGGGAIAIRAKGGITIGSNATIEANGSNGSTPSSNSSGTGGGGGGVIILASQGSILNNAGGAIRANGGAGGNGGSLGAMYPGGGGGGGGVIHLLAPNADNIGETGTLSVGGGAAGATGGSGSPAEGYGGGASAGNGGNGMIVCCGLPFTVNGASGLIFRTPYDPTALFD